MIFKNLFRQKGRTILTIFGISIGVAAIVGLGALAEGLKTGYDSILSGSKADLILSQPDAVDLTTTSVDEGIGGELIAMPEVAAVSGMLQGFVLTENVPYFFIYGYPADSFILNRFHVIEGGDLDSREAKQAHGKPLLLGASAADVLDKEAGDTLRIMNSVFRVVGIYETGATLEDNGAVISLLDAQELLGKPRQVSVFYIQLKDPGMRARLEKRASRLWSDLSISGTDEFAEKQLMGDYIQAAAWGIAGLAILIGGVSMMNAQLMSVVERTREIGVLKATGWSSGRVLSMIMSESLLVCLAGGLVGVFLGWFLLLGLSNVVGFFGASAANINAGILVQAFVTVIIIGLVSGFYPAWKASRLEPVEALRYEGGTSGISTHRLPLGGLSVQNLWQRRARTLLTLGVIGITVGGIMALEGLIGGLTDVMSTMAGDSEIIVRQAGVADTEYSALDERIGEKIAVLPGVAHVSGLGFTGTVLPDSGTIFIMFGYAPHEYNLQQFNIAEGEILTNNRQMLLGRMMANSLKKSVGDMIEVGGSRFKVVGIYESGSAWEEMGGVISLRDAQSYMGRPRKVTMYLIKVEDPSQAPDIVARINTEFPEVHASLSGEFVEQMPDMQTVDGLLAGISLLAIGVGGIGVLNTMLMSVLERTREIGVLRALGWQRRRVLGMIMNESLLLGLAGSIVGILVAFGLTFLFSLIPMYGSIVSPDWNLVIFARALIVALVLGIAGGLYPAIRATRLRPVEALRYE
ncbi:MAG: ABC transporter permease [Anaerolineales bacterium]|jgi:ABC-type antimicrobial peptide transport system permease subunit